MMGEEWRILFLLLHKNFIVRSRHWIGTICEVVTPACIFAIIMGLRTLLIFDSITVDTSTIYPVFNRSYLNNNFPLNLLRVMYVPQNDFTDRIMNNASDCLGISSNQLYGFDSEDTMLQSYERIQALDMTISVLAVVFENTEGVSMPENLQYTMKTSYAIGRRLSVSTYEGPSTLSDTLINQIPFVALQMCVDDSFISTFAPSYISEQMVTDLKNIWSWQWRNYVSVGPCAIIQFGSLVLTHILKCNYISTSKLRISVSTNTRNMRSENSEFAEKYTSRKIVYISFRTTFKKELEKINSVYELAKFLIIKYELLNTSFMDLCSTLILFLTLPIATSIAERSFSKLKIIKNYLRSTMAQTRLTSLAILSIESKKAQEMNIEDIIKSAKDEFPLNQKRVIQKMPYPPYQTTTTSESFFRDTLGYWAPIMFLVTLFMVPSYITTEKDTGVNALLKLNGVKTYQNYLSWLIGGMAMGTVTVGLITVVLKVYFTTDQLPFYYYSNGFILWLAVFINYVHTYAFCLHVASYFTKARLAQLAMVIITYAIQQIMNQLESNEMYSILPYAGLVFPTAASIRLFDEFSSFDDSMVGVQWNNLFTTNHEVLGFDGTLGFIMIFSVLATICHFCVALYIDAILPSKYSVQESPLFFLKYFRKNKVSIGNENHTDKVADSDEKPEILEHIADGALTPGIQIRNLKKTFNIGCFNQRTVEAIRGISLDFYKGEITALLGHNGAGKTTTISILTGLTAQTSGSVFVNGQNLSGDIQAIRNDMGVCPQENMGFSNLTVMEQLRLFGLLKQKERTNEQVIANVEDLLLKLKLSEKRNTLPKNLSGGQKRRLCLGMALIGNASTLILDEPTSGMDPETSRVIWEIILKFRKQKTIIITTHSMEEADVLGDRIAIMHDGKMKCYGSSMFLKKFYGENYQEVNLSVEPWCEPEKIRAIVGSQAKTNATTYGRLVLSIPLEDSLPKNLDKIENSKAELGITGVSVNTITLEQVFLKAAKEEEDQEIEEKKRTDVQPYTKLIGFELTKQIIYALMDKKVSYAINNWGIQLGIIFGTLLSVILIPIIKVERGTRPTHHRPLNLTLYPDSEALIFGENETLVNAYKDIVENQEGLGTLLATEVNIIDALLEKAVTAGIVYYTDNIIISAEFHSSNDSLIAKGLYSGSARLSAPITVNTMSNSLLKVFAGNEYSINASIENLPASFVDNIYDEFTIKTDNLLEMMLFTSIFFIIIGLFAINPLLEATTSVKQLQRMTGVSAFSYWGTMFICDYPVYILASTITVIGFIMMDLIVQSHMYYAQEVGFLMFLLLLFGINTLLLAYILSFWKKPLYMILLVLSLATTIIAQVEVFIDLALGFLASYNTFFVVQRRIFSLLPHVSFTFGYTKFLETATNNARCRQLPNSYIEITCLINDPCCDLGCTDGSCESSLPYFGNFSEDASLEEFVLYLALTPIGLLAILFALEYRYFEILVSKLRSSKAKPSDHTVGINTDVLIEKREVRQAINEYEEGLNGESVFLAYEMSKRYGNFEAVKEVNFRVKKNECFGLLGVNGAGKSTTFRMLVGEEIPTTGILLRDRNNIKSNRVQYLAGIGYCPQMNALIPSFNAYEHLTLFARLRGIPSSEIASHVQWWIENLGLSKYAKNLSKSYSGGNKRRLNIAVALIANPELVLLDEPTAGVDPRARRSLWTVLQNCQASGQAIILTSHSMQECEVLCSRLLIMVRGRLVCIGASQQLKQAYGAGYDIIIKLNPERSVNELRYIQEKIQSSFLCELRDEHLGCLYYHISDPHITWSKMFDTMNGLKSQHNCIEDFAVSSSTLEQLFIQFARTATGSIATAPAPSTNGSVYV